MDSKISSIFNYDLFELVFYLVGWVELKKLTIKVKIKNNTSLLKSVIYLRAFKKYVPIKTLHRNILVSHYNDFYYLKMRWKIIL